MLLHACYNINLSIKWNLLQQRVKAPGPLVLYRSVTFICNIFLNKDRLVYNFWSKIMTGLHFCLIVDITLFFNLINSIFH